MTGETADLISEERQAAARALLARPLIDRSDPDALALVRRHRHDLARFFAEELGYRLDAARPGLARLAKAARPGHVPRGLRTRSGRSFDGRRYALVCLILAALEGEGERTTAARLFRDVASRAAAVDDLPFSTEMASDRRAFVQSVQAIVDLGVLELAEGDEERFARAEEGGDALYRVDRERLALLPAVVQPASLAASPEAMLTETYPDTEDGSVRRRRHRVLRALLEQPVVYAEDLTPDEVDYLTGQRARIERVLDRWLGLTLEVRAEGWVAVDPDGDLSDIHWPGYGAPETAALRICDHLRTRRLAGQDEPWAMPEVTAFVAGLAAEYAGYWRRDAGEGDGATLLAGQAVAILCSLRLATVAGGALVARPAAGRFAARAVTTPTASPLPRNTPLEDAIP